MYELDLYESVTAKSDFYELYLLQLVVCLSSIKCIFIAALGSPEEVDQTTSAKGEILSAFKGQEQFIFSDVVILFATKSSYFPYYHQ